MSHRISTAQVPSVEAELERLLCDEADDPENATCAIRELQRALKDRRRRTRAWMAVEDDALRAILTVLIDIVRNVIAMVE